MASDDKTEQRIADLEIQMAHQSETIDALNEAVVEQWKTIDRLSRQIKVLNEQLVSLEDDASSHKVTKPPHY